MSFHAPERARLVRGPLASSALDGNNGAFDLESCITGWRLALIVSDGTESAEVPDYQWEHVSVHAYAYHGKHQRTPTWEEMAYVKRLLWDAEDVVMQLHPRESEYVNNHPHVLHLWRPKFASIPVPPSELVGMR